MSKQKRFLPLKNHKGIRKDSLTGKYVARKYIDGKEYCETFDKISAAERWRRNFHPLLTNTEIKGVSSRGVDLGTGVNVQARLNGVDGRFTLKQVWELYQKHHFPALEQQTRETIKKFSRYFFAELMSFKMQEINPELLDSFMTKKVKEAKKLNNPRRQSFKNDLKSFKTLLNWYRENYDGMFVVPVLKRHFIIGIIKNVPKRNTEKMNLEQVHRFLDAFDSPFWQDFAELQFFMAGRAQEVGGLQWESIDFERRLIRVTDVSVWNLRNKKFGRLKENPKNGEQRIVCLNGNMLNILKRRWEQRSNIPCKFFRESTGQRLSFVFEVEGQPVSYRNIQYYFNQALKKARLFPRFRSTHILRKAMANIVRQELGLDAAQAVGGWKSRGIVERTYTDAPNQLNREAVEHVERMVASASNRDGAARQTHLRLVQNELE